MEAIFHFTAILKPDEDRVLDEYCTGMTYGLQGSKVLVSVANVFMGKDGKLRKPSLNPSDLKSSLKSMEESIYRTAS